MTISTMTMLTSAHGAQNDHRTDNYNNSVGAQDVDSAQSVLYDQNAHSVHRTLVFILGLEFYSPLFTKLLSYITIPKK